MGSQMTVQSPTSFSKTEASTNGCMGVLSQNAVSDNIPKMGGKITNILEEMKKFSLELNDVAIKSLAVPSENRLLFLRSLILLNH
jgi:starvation-inducible outer membrane lipoprotein